MKDGKKVGRKERSRKRKEEIKRGKEEEGLRKNFT